MILSNLHSNRVVHLTYTTALCHCQLMRRAKVFMHASLCPVATSRPFGATCLEHSSYELASHVQAVHAESPHPSALLHFSLASSGLSCMCCTHYGKTVESWFKQPSSSAGNSVVCELRQHDMQHNMQHAFTCKHNSCTPYDPAQCRQSVCHAQKAPHMQDDDTNLTNCKTDKLAHCVQTHCKPQQKLT